MLHVTKPREYSVNDYSVYNDSINNELNYHREIAQSIYQETILKKAKVAVLITISIAILAIAAALVYLIVNYANSEANVIPLQAQNTQESQDLGTISRIEGSPEFGISKAFNVFDSTSMSSGEIVVTAKEYRPDNLTSPDYQYCYLTSSISIVNAEQIELAEINPDTDELIIKTDDVFLIESALPLCTFIE